MKKWTGQRKGGAALITNYCLTPCLITQKNDPDLSKRAGKRNYKPTPSRGRSERSHTDHQQQDRTKSSCNSKKNRRFSDASHKCAQCTDTTRRTSLASRSTMTHYAFAVTNYYPTRQ